MAATGSVFKVVNAIFASVIFIQSIIWGVLSLLAILCTYGAIKVDLKDPHTFPNVFTTQLYMLYLGNLEYPPDFRIFPSEYFIYIFWVFFLISLFLIFTSAANLVHLAQNAKRNKLNASATVLVILTFVSCVYDLVATIIFAIDYVSIRDSIDLPGMSPELEYTLSIPLIMATLAAKGYVLWLVNFTMAICISQMMSKKGLQDTHLEPDEHVFSRTNSAYKAFGDIRQSSGIEEPQNERRPSQAQRRLTHANPYAQTGNLDDGHSTTTSWAQMPRCTIYLEPFDSIAPQSAAEFAPQSPWYGSTPNLTMVEPEPDYTPEPTRRLGMNHASGTSPDNMYATR